MTAAVAALLSTPLHAIQDSNNNGLSDVWEKFYNNDNLFPSSSPYFAEDDPDADGWTNADEAVAGTNPFNTALPEGWVRTSIQAHPNAEGCFMLSWPSIAGKAYRLSVSTNLVDWADFGEVMAGTGSEIALALDCEYEEGGTPERMFWRVRIDDADPDGDGLTTWEELALQTDPYHPDTDRDGIFDNLDVDPLISATLADPDGLGLPASLDTGLIGRWDFESSYFASTSGAAGLPVRPRNGSWTPNEVAGAVPAKFSGLADAQGMISKGGDNRQSQFVLIDGNILKNHHGAFSTSFWAKLNPAEISGSGSPYYKALWSLTEGDNATNIEGNALLVRKVGNEEEWYLGGYEWTSTGGQADSAFLGQTVRFPAGTHDDDEWHHFVITRGGGRWKLVIDGEQCLDFSGGWVPLDFHPLTTNPLNPSTLLLLGRFHEGSSTNQLNASIDRLKVWSRTLNPTNPDEIGHLWKQDADNDGLWDVTEVRTSLWRDLNSNALRDSNEFAYISSPFEWQFATTDSDGDEASDLDEQTAGTLIGKSDSDGDLLPDGWELLHGLNPLVSNATDSNSNGVFEDNEYTNSDNDSLTDIQEYRHNTDPKLANSDGGDPLNPDNVNDSTEVAQGSNPNDPTDGGQAPSPNEMLSLKLGIGDQSGSKSEDYVMHCYRLDPETGIETRVYTLRSGGYGKYEEKTVGNVFRRGETYTYQIKWQGSKLTSQSASGGQSAEGPDFDYTFKVEPQGDNFGFLAESWDSETKTLDTSHTILAADASDVADDLSEFHTNYERQRVVLLPITTYSADRMFAASIHLPLGFERLSFQVRNPVTGHDFGTHHYLMGAPPGAGVEGPPAAKVYNSIAGMLGTEDADGYAVQETRVWFMRSGDPEKPGRIEIYLVSPEDPVEGYGSIEITPKDGETELGTVERELTPDQEMADVIEAVTKVASGEGFDFCTDENWQLPGFGQGLALPEQWATPMLIPFLAIAFQVEYMTICGTGIIEGVVNGLLDDCRLIEAMTKFGAVATGWAKEAAMAELARWRDDPRARLAELKQATVQFFEDCICRPVSQYVQKASTPDGFRDVLWDSLYRNPLTNPGKLAHDLAQKHGDAFTQSIWESLSDWLSDFGNRMADGARNHAWINLPLDTAVLEAGGTQLAREQAYTFGYTFGYLCEQVGVGVATAGVGKFAQVAKVGGSILVGQLASKTLAGVAIRTTVLKKWFASVAISIELRLAVEQGCSVAGRIPLAAAGNRVVLEVIEDGLARQGFDGSLMNWKVLMDDALAQPRLLRAFEIAGYEAKYLEATAELVRRLGATTTPQAMRQWPRLCNALAPLNEGAIADDVLRMSDLFTALKFDTGPGQQVMKELLESLEGKTAAEILDGPALPSSIKDLYPAMYHYSSDAVLPAIRRQSDGSLLLPANPSGSSTYWTPSLIDDAADPRLILQAPGAAKRYRIETDVFEGDNAFYMARAYDLENQVSRNWIEMLIKDNPTSGFELGPPQVTTRSGRKVRVYDRNENRYLDPNEFE